MAYFVCHTPKWFLIWSKFLGINPLVQVENDTMETDFILNDLNEDFVGEMETLTLTPFPIFEEDIKDLIQERYLYTPRDWQRSRELRGKLFRLWFGDVDDDIPAREPFAVIHFPQWQPRYWALL